MVFLILRHVTKQKFQVHPLSSLLAFSKKVNSKSFTLKKNENNNFGSLVHHQHNICKTVISWKVPAVINSFCIRTQLLFHKQVFSEHFFSQLMNKGFTQHVFIEHLGGALS